MKNILFLILMIAPFMGLCNDPKTKKDSTVKDTVRLSDTRILVISTKTKLLISGSDACEHDWAVRDRDTIKTCDHPGRIHDEAGCPYTWAHDFRICTNCRRHEEITESRNAHNYNKPVVIKKDRYHETLNKP